MKKLIVTFYFLLYTIIVFGEAPIKFSYQAVIRNESGQLVTNASLSFRVSLLKNLNGDAIYTEIHNVNSNSNGLVTLLIGDGSNKTGDLIQVNWNDGPYFLKSEWDLKGGSNFIVSGTTQLLSVPYSLFSNVAQRSIEGPTSKSIENMIRDSVNFSSGAFLISKKNGIQIDTNNIFWNDEYKQLLVGGSMRGTLIDGYSSGFQVIQNTNVWPQVSVYSTGVTSNSLPRFRGANIRGTLLNFENTIRSSVLMRLAGTGSVDNPDVLRAGAQIEIESAKNWTSTSSPGNIVFETVPIDDITYRNFATFTHNGSFQIGFNHPNSLHQNVDSKTKLLALASDNSDSINVIEVKKYDLSGSIYSLRNDGLTSLNKLNVSGKSNLESTEIKTGEWIYFGPENLDGSWRFGVQSGNFVHQKREQGNWVTKQSIQ